MTKEQNILHQEQIAALTEENAALKKKLETFQELDEELTAKRVYELAVKRIKALLSFGGILTVIVGLIGYKTILDKTDSVVSKMDSTAVLNMAISEVNKKVLPKLSSQLVAESKSQVQHITDSLRPIVATQIKQQVDALSKPINSTQRATETEQTEVPRLTSFPSRADLSNEMTPVRNQGSEGSVVAFALESCLEYIIKSQTGKQIILSPRYIYNSIKTGNGDNGAFIKDGIRFLNTTGAIEESFWPYIPGHFNDPIPNAAKEAPHFRIKGFGKANVSIDDFKNLLAQDIPIVVGITLTNSDITETASTGILPPYNPKSQILGGHAICLVGYDDETKRFKFKNSWGKSWGDNGYGYLAYARVTNSTMDDAWFIKSIY